eukprot:3797900-Prymnesium_polylepis.2
MLGQLVCAARPPLKPRPAAGSRSGIDDHNIASKEGRRVAVPRDRGVPQPPRPGLATTAVVPIPAIVRVVALGDEDVVCEAHRLCLRGPRLCNARIHVPVDGAVRDVVHEVVRYLPARGRYVEVHPAASVCVSGDAVEDIGAHEQRQHGAT